MDRDEKIRIRDKVRRAFGEALEEARMAAGEISQEKLANKVGLDRTTVSAIERGTQSASVETIWILCDGLEDSPSELMVRVERLARRSPRKKR